MRLLGRVTRVDEVQNASVGACIIWELVLDASKGREYTTVPGPPTTVGIPAKLKAVSELLHLF
jgi:hypothetical protein